MYTFSIQTVAERTGLTTHAIRAWERRYGAIEPARTPGRHRLYSEEDLIRLNLLAEACRSGRQISQVSKLTNEELRSLLGPEASWANAPRVGKSGLKEDPGDAAFCKMVEEAVLKLDSQALDNALQKAQVALGDQGLLRRVLAPMARQVGMLWRMGRISAAQEHFYTAMAKVFAWNFTRQYRSDTRAPRMVVGTPAGQLHDLGAMLAAAAAANSAWSLVYLGPSLPALELAGAVQMTNAQALALSLVYPEDDPALPKEIETLGGLLPEHVQLIVGGPAAGHYAQCLENVGARMVESLEDLDEVLDSLRRRPRRF